jgi:hypothetical protein
MNDSSTKTFNKKIWLAIIVFLLLIVIVVVYIYFHSTKRSGFVTITNQATAYATYGLKDPNRLPITQYPKAYGVELDFVATSSEPLPPNLCLKVAADVPIKAFSIPNNPDASSTIPATKYGGAFEGVTCFAGSITPEEDTTVFFNDKPSEINAILSPSNAL